MAIQQVSVFVRNKPGALSAICKLLAESGVDMRAMFISDTKEFSILRLIADDTEKAAEVLRDQNCIVSINPVIGVAVPDAPGGIAGMLRVLSETGMNVEYTYAFVAHPGERAYVVLRVTDIAAAEDILKKAGFLLITEQDIQNL